MADEEFAELGDIQLSQFDRSNAHWASTNCGRGGTTFSCATSEHQQQTNRLYSRRPISTINSCGVGSGGGATYYSRAAEAEDVMGHYNSYKSANYTGTNNNKWSLYYSPPGTSSLNTIAGSSGRNSVHHQTQLRLHPRTSNNSMAVGKQQQPLSSAQHFYQQRNATGANNKRPISPEQVIKMLSSRQHNKTTVANNVTNNLKSPSGSSNPQAQSFSRKLPNQAPNLDELPVKTITMIRDNTPGTSQGFGICVKGGSREPNNVGVYISRVEEGGVAEKAGLRPGDSILEVNGIPFNNISHEEALKILKSKQQITMTVKTTPLSQRLNLNKNNSWILQHSYTWIDRMGRTVSPPPDYVKTNTSNKWTSSKISKEKIRKAELTIDSGQTLGLVIRGGIEYGLGIFITGVDKNSVADKAGLQIGDQILDVNGTSFLDITHDDAVSYLKQYNRMTITIRDVGKIPHSFTTYDTDSSTHPRTTLRKIPRSQTIQMIEEKASIVLEKNDFENFSYYLEEYCSKKITFDTFITVLMDLLDTPEKYTLMTELREVFTTEDKPKFDEIVYQKHSSETQKNYNSKTRLKNAEHTYGRTSPHIQNIPSQQTRSKINKFSTEDNYVTCTQETDGLRSPSEDSGLGLGPPEMGNGRNVSTRNFRNESGIYSDQKQLRHDSEFQSQVSIEEDLGYYHQDYSEDEPVPRTKRRSSVSECIQRSNDMNPTCEDANMCGYLEGLRSQLGGWTQKLKDWYWGGNSLLARKLGQGCDINDTNNKDQQTGNRQQQNKKGDSSSSEKNAHIVTDSQGNLRITVKKTKPLLGIAIEGGVNTRHPLPRIINIHEHGAAFEAGGLEVGQLILEVDRRKVEGMQHQEVARLIAEIYANRDCPTIEFLVVEAKKSNMEPKPTALIFLDN